MCSRAPDAVQRKGAGMEMIGRGLIFKGKFAWSALHSNIALVKLKSGHVHTHANSEQFTVSSLLSAGKPEPPQGEQPSSTETQLPQAVTLPY